MIKGNPYIGRVLIYDMTTAFQLQLNAERFDVIVNLERIPEVCALIDSIYACRRYGFRFDPGKRRAEAYEHAYEAVANSEDPKG